MLIRYLEDKQKFDSFAKLGCASFKMDELNGIATLDRSNYQI